jgi:hypothetical protein
VSWADPWIPLLEGGETVQFRPKGNSMRPRIESGALVTMEPCSAPEVGDAVLCKVQGKVTLHLVGATGHRGYRIQNARGHVDGWTRTIYGRVVEVED